MKSRRNRRAKIKFYLNEIANQDGKLTTVAVQTTDEMRHGQRASDPIQHPGQQRHCGRAPDVCALGPPSGDVRVLRPQVQIID